MKLTPGAGGSIVGAVLAAIGASLCCVGPLVLVTIGVGGAWVSSLTALEPLRPVFVLLALGFFAWAYHRLYRRAPACEPGRPCADNGVIRRQRGLFWVALVGVVALVSFPWYASLFY
jgi:mercuric ion transport protein